MISDAMLAQVQRKQQEFLDAVLEATQLWTRELTLPRALEAGRRVGLESVLVSEFLEYWINLGEIEPRYRALAARIREET